MHEASRPSRVSEAPEDTLLVTSWLTDAVTFGCHAVLRSKQHKMRSISAYVAVTQWHPDKHSQFLNSGIHTLREVCVLHGNSCWNLASVGTSTL